MKKKNEKKISLTLGLEEEALFPFLFFSFLFFSFLFLSFSSFFFVEDEAEEEGELKVEGEVEVEPKEEVVEPKPLSKFYF